MSRLRELVRSWVLPFVDPRQLASLVYLPRFLSELSSYRRLANGQRVRLGDAYPCLSDRLPRTPFDPHYFFQGAWLSRRLRETRVEQHVDVGSSVVMLSVLSAQLPVLFVDYRPLRVALPGLTCIGGDLTRLPFADNSIESLSCLHVIEHVGLGRYGDRINPRGSEQAMQELARVVRTRRTLVRIHARRPRTRVLQRASRLRSTQARAVLPGHALSRVQRGRRCRLVSRARRSCAVCRARLWMRHVSIGQGAMKQTVKRVLYRLCSNALAQRGLQSVATVSELLMGIGSAGDAASSGEESVLRRLRDRCTGSAL